MGNFNERVCVECNRIFLPSSAHKKCSICRSKAAKHLCAKCRKVMVNRASVNCIKCHNGSGEESPSWRGGRTKESKGYILISAKSHPRASSNHGYLFEHVLVMEKFLGRYLLPGENIHHRNGIKNDNTLSNLELWIKTQPPGQRVSDLITWSINFIAQYDKKFTPAPVRINTISSVKMHNLDGLIRKHNHAGYIFVYYQEHPRSKANTGRIFEHIVVMENMLGRYLLPGENVHHRNGVKDDNRTENLELWVVQQPSGQRVEDLLTRAREILDLYADDYALVS